MSNLDFCHQNPNGHKPRYSEIADAYYCKLCDEYLEDYCPCGECEFCEEQKNEEENEATD